MDFVNFAFRQTPDRVQIRKPAMCIEICEFVHGWPLTNSQISIHTAGRVHNTSPEPRPTGSW